MTSLLLFGSIAVYLGGVLGAARFWYVLFNDMYDENPKNPKYSDDELLLAGLTTLGWPVVAVIAPFWLAGKFVVRHVVTRETKNQCKRRLAREAHQLTMSMQEYNLRGLINPTNPTNPTNPANPAKKPRIVHFTKEDLEDFEDLKDGDYDSC